MRHRDDRCNPPTTQVLVGDSPSLPPGCPLDPSPARRRAAGWRAGRARRLLGWVTTALAMAWAGPAPAQTPPAPTTSLARPAGVSGTVVVPDRFLRRWDPVTVFFAADTGPAGGGPEDHSARVARIEPAHPGAWRWLDARTLQFRPAEPWPSLGRLAVWVGGSAHRLITLMAAPSSTIPADGAEGLDPVEEVTLTFSEPVDAATLTRMVRIELRPLPGVEPEGSRFVEGDDLGVKVGERPSRDAAATYVLQLRQPVPLGTRAIVHLRLSADDAADRAFARVSFATAETFRVLSVGCAAAGVPLTPAGSRYGTEQALRCEGDTPRLLVRFSSAPRELGPVEARNLVRLSPAVDNLEFAVNGTSLVVSGSFARETLYRVALAPTALADTHGRALDIRGESELYLSFPRKAAFLQWGASSAILERLGPQMVPLQGRGDERVDLRLHRVEALDRRFWPFPDAPVRTDDDERPPGPGEEPSPAVDESREVSEWELREHLRTLGSPQVSVVQALPLRGEGPAATFGLDLAPHLARAGGKAQPGAYLVGIRRLGPSSDRSWMRVQVTDLALATFEEAGAVVFVVTSLSTAQAVPGARVRVDGYQWGAGTSAWVTLFEGTTGPDGTIRWPAPGSRDPRTVRVRRLVVEKDGDRLVLDPDHAPDGFADGRWQPTRQTWLQWTQESLGGRLERTRYLCHVFTERPVYRPEETVHIKGWIRERYQGRLKPAAGSGTLLVEGPGGIVWRFPVELSPTGAFYQAFAADDLPTGAFTAAYEDPDLGRLAEVRFRMEAYRLPEFEIQLAAPERAALDGEVKVGLVATYYAGGRVAARPVRWRVTQFPYAWQPRGREGFLFSSDARFAGARRFEGSPRLEEEGVTDAEGGATLVLNPAAETTAQPRTYVVEATVTGADDQTVTAVHQIVAVPPFVLGLSAPRFLANATTISPEVLVLGVDDAPLAGLPVTVRLKHRQWHSVLQASDFAQGKARYLTDVVDEQVAETTVTSGSGPVPVPLPIRTAGVYIVELEAADRLGRAQVVSVDLYAGGPEPVAWPKPATPVFTMASDKAQYDPGDTARLVLESPFQSAQALVVVEAPDGNQYRWVEVRGGAATVEVPVLPAFVPRLPMHAVLMRGRVRGAAPGAGSVADLGKPTTMAATTWLAVRPVSNRVEVGLSHPERALPGSKVEVAVRLADPQGRPLAGEVTLWLVDAAVLALGREQRLDPLPDFIDPVRSRLAVRDTRTLVPGEIPFAELPGGDEGEEGGLLERTTVRRIFKSVPYYNPAIQVGPDGVATVTVELPDNLTVFKLRAKAVAGPDRFGVGTSQIAVRLPVIVQPALPRFVRPGDRFEAAAVGRVVEGEGGPGKAEWQVDGVALAGPPSRDLAWVPNQPLRISFPVEVTTPAEDGTRQREREVTFRVAVARTADGARDAFEVKLPVHPDRTRTVVRLLQELEAGKPLAVPAIPEAVRPGTARRTLVVSEQAGLVRMAAGLSFLLDYPYGCTEQRISRTRAQVAMARLRGLLAQEGGEKELERAVRDTLDWIDKTVTTEGLVAYWPGGRGYVSLTAWTVQFLVEAKDAGYAVEATLVDRLTRTLEQALRSDYSRFIDGASWAERSWALLALAQAGRAQPAYAAELARRAQYLDEEGIAAVLHAYARAGQADAPAARELRGRVWDGLVFRLHQGKEIYGGLQQRAVPQPALILPSETRTVAEATRAVVRSDPTHPRVQVLVDALVTLGRDDGWGSTNANAAAMLALAEVLQPPFAGASARQVKVELGGATTLALGPDAPLQSWRSPSPGAGTITLAPGAGRPVVARLETSWVAAADGSQVTPTANGFVVSREWLRWKGEDQPFEKLPLAEAATRLELEVGGVVEEHAQVVSPADRAYVAVVVPLAAGMEPLNPALATAPPEARPSGSSTLAATYVAFMDDHVAFYYDWLPKGTYDFYFRTRATVAGEYVQPPARAEMMYDGAVWGQGAGARVVVHPPAVAGADAVR